MSETQSTFFNLRAGGLWMAGAFILLAIIFVVSFPSPSPSIPEPFSLAETPNAPSRLGEPPHILPRTRFQSSTLDNRQRCPFLQKDSTVILECREPTADGTNSQ